MAGNGATTATRLLTEARAALGPSTAADVLAVRLGERPTLPAHLLATMRVGSTVTVDGATVQRTGIEMWEFRTQDKAECAVVCRGVDGVDAYGSRGWRVVEVDSDGEQVTLDDTKSVEAALSSALVWASH